MKKIKKGEILDFVKKNKIVILVLVFAIFLFYFFTIRPNQIRKDCYRKSIGEYYQYWGSNQSKYYGHYVDCLHANGFDK